MDTRFYGTLFAVRLTCGVAGCDTGRTSDWHQNFKHLPPVWKRKTPAPSPSSLSLPNGIDGPVPVVRNARFCAQSAGTARTSVRSGGRPRPEGTPLRRVSSLCAQPRAFWWPTPCETHATAHSRPPLHAPACIWAARRAGDARHCVWSAGAGNCLRSHRPEGLSS